MVSLHYNHIRVATYRRPAVFLLLFFVGIVLLSACTQGAFTSSQNWRSAHADLCEKETGQKWESYGIGDIVNVDCLKPSDVYVDGDIGSGDFQMTPTMVYFTGKWNHKWATICYTGAAEIFSQCGIQVSAGKIIGVKSSDYERIDSRRKLAVLRSRIDDQDFSVFPSFLVVSSYMENWMTTEGEEKVVNGFVTRGGDNSNNAVIINASVRNDRKKCGVVTAHEWVHFIRDWPGHQYPGNDVSGHHPSEDNLLYKSLAATSLTIQQCRQIIENGIRRGIIKVNGER